VHVRHACGTGVVRARVAVGKRTGTGVMVLIVVVGVVGGVVPQLVHLVVVDDQHHLLAPVVVATVVMVAVVVVVAVRLHEGACQPSRGAVGCRCGIAAAT